MSSILKSIHLGGERYLVVDDEYDLMITDQRSGKCAFFTGPRWSRLVGDMNGIDVMVQRANNDKPTDFKRHLGGRWHVSVKDGVLCVDFRRWYMKDNDLHPTTSGITLTYGQWNKLKDAVETLQNEVPALTAISPCWHESQVEMEHCRECSPFNNDNS